MSLCGFSKTFERRFSVVLIRKAVFFPITNAYLGPYQKSLIDLFCINISQLKAVHYFYKKLQHRCLAVSKYTCASITSKNFLKPTFINILLSNKTLS